MLCTYRYYDPTRGRWLTRDPIGYGGGLNLYGYCGADPVGGVDATGEFVQILVGAGIGLAFDAAVQLATTGHWDWRRGAAAAAAGAATALLGPAAGMLARGLGGGLLGAAGAGAAMGAAGAAVGTGVGNALNGQPLTKRMLGNMAAGAVGGAIMGGAGYAMRQMLGRARGNPTARQTGGCFVAGTPVQMADGTSRPIEEVKAGDRVLARDEVTGATGAQTVEEAFAHVAASSVVLHLDSGETVETTDEHPFYVAATGFVPAGRLAVGNAIVTRAGPPAVVVAIEHRRRPLEVHNLRVEGAHTYFVGLSGGGVWVHNQACPPASGGRPAGYGRKAPETVHPPMRTNDGLEAAQRFLGPGYREVSPGRYVSADGTRQVRLGTHEVIPGQEHIHFETLQPNSVDGTFTVRHTDTYPLR